MGLKVLLEWKRKEKNCSTYECMGSREIVVPGKNVRLRIFFFNVGKTIFLSIFSLLMELSDVEEGKLMIQQRGENYWTDSPYFL